MGLLSWIKPPTTRSNIVNIDASLGNVLITGGSKKGIETLIKNYAIDSLNRNYGLVIFRDQNTGINSYPSIVSSGRSIYEIDCTDNCTTEQLDILAGLNDNDTNAMIIKLFDSYNEIEKSKKMTYLNYIALMRNLLKKAGKTVKINELVDYPIEEVENLNLRYCANNPMEQSRNDRFLNSIRTDITNLESYFYDFSQNVLGYVFSGNRTIDMALRTKSVIEISLDFTRKPDESKIIMATVIEAINKCNLNVSGKQSINVIVDGVPNEILIESGLQKLIKGGKGYNALYTVQDISNLIESSNEWIDYANSYFFFRQNSNKNKEFCSEFFGTYEKEKVTHNQGKTSASFWDRVSGRGGTSYNGGTSVTYEKERVYLPDVFASLPDNQAIYYLKDSNEHNKLNVY